MKMIVQDVNYFAKFFRGIATPGGISAIRMLKYPPLPSLSGRGMRGKTPRRGKTHRVLISLFIYKLM